jgi:hypothetical protein
VEVEILLDHVEVHAAVPGDVVGVVLAHQLEGALDDPADAGGADEHVVRLLLQHELARAAERVEARFAQRGELVLPVAVGEVGEHEERQPVGRLLVEGAEDARVVGVARMPLEHLVGLVAAVAAEVPVQQVHHRPEVAALLDVDLEQVAHVVERWRGQAQVPLLLDRRRLGVALHHDETAEIGAVLAGHLLPGVVTHVVAEGDLAIRFGLRQEDPPPVVGHLDVVEVGPAVAADVDRRPEEDRVVLEGDRAELLPPADELGLPALERPLEAPVVGEADVVRDLGVDVDGDAHVVSPFVTNGWCQAPTVQTRSRS